MATVVFVHAHPDDEATLTSGSMARASAEGHRVVTVIATGGEHGEAPTDLAPGETLADRRRREAEHSADVLGVHRLAWLGYIDSGMRGWEQNTHGGTLAAADVDEAAARLAALLDEEGADIVVGYDWHGNYGHPDHVRVHEITRRSLGLVRTRRPRLLEATMNRGVFRTLMEAARQAGIEDSGDPEARGEDHTPRGEDGMPLGQDGTPLGTPQELLHWAVDVTAYLDQRRASVAAHASQVTDTGRILSMEPDLLAVVFGQEYYIEPGRPDGMRSGWFLEP